MNIDEGIGKARMFELIKKVLLTAGESRGASEKDHEKEVLIAASVILLEAAGTDSELLEDELEHVLDTMRTRFGLSDDYARELMDLAHKERERVIDLFHFTKTINENHSRREKIEILEAVWRIIHMDGRLDKYEDHYAHKLSNLLRLSHKELIDAKIRAREQLNERT